MKIMLISRSFPPRVSGSAIVLGNLFKHFPQDSYIVFKESEHGRSTDASNNLDCKIYSYDLSRYNAYMGRLLRVWSSYFLIFILTVKIIKVIKKERTDIVFSVYPYPSFFISSFLAHKLAKKPLFVYMHDTWEDAMGEGAEVHRFMARIFERRIFRSASGVFVINEPLQHLYMEKYGIISMVLPHCIELPEEPPNRDYIPRKEQDIVSIVFTGDIYKTNVDAIKNMVDAMNSLPDNYRLILCTPADVGDLKQYGIGETHKVEIRFVETRDKVLSLQREADILFLPLAFNSIVPLMELATIFPTKTVEYMISGNPILVHAPSGYYVCRYAMEAGWGFVVDNPDPGSLREAVSLLVRDAELRRRLIHNAWQTAAIYDGVSVSRKLRQYLSCDVESK